MHFCNYFDDVLYQAAPLQGIHINFLGDVYNIAWSGSNRWLLAGTAAGLVGWNIEDNKVKEQGKDYKYVYFVTYKCSSTVLDGRESIRKRPSV